MQNGIQWKKTQPTLHLNNIDEDDTAKKPKVVFDHLCTPPLVNKQRMILTSSSLMAYLKLIKQRCK